MRYVFTAECMEEMRNMLTGSDIAVQGVMGILQKDRYTGVHMKAGYPMHRWIHRSTRKNAYPITR